MAKLTGLQKAAAVLLALGEQGSAQILKNLTPQEIQKLGSQIARLDTVAKDIVDELLKEFLQNLEQEQSIQMPGNIFLKKLLPAVLPPEEAGAVLTRIEEENRKIPFKNLQEVDPRVLANFIKNEHPQTIAIILVHLEHEKASEVLSLLPENLQFEVTNRIATLETVPPDLLREVDEVLEKELLSMADEGYKVVGGVQTVAELLNRCDRRTSDNILQALEDHDAELADSVRNLMFVFDDLVNVNDQGIRELLKEITNDDLILSLKTASEEVKQKIFKNLSQRAAQMLMEDMEVMGPVRLSDVEAAQRNILNVARKLEKEGRLILARGDGGDALV